jgi:hypothetical protein
VIDVEQCSLCTFEQQPLACTNQRVHFGRNVGNHRLQALAELQRFIERFLEVDRRRLEVVTQHEVVIVEHFAELGRETLAREQVLHADCTPRDLVLVRGADAATGGTDLRLTHRGFARAVERDVMRQDQRARFRDAQAGRHVDATALQLGHLFEQGLRRQHHAVADEAGHALVKNAEGIRRSTVFLPLMTSVCPAL